MTMKPKAKKFRIRRNGTDSPSPGVPPVPEQDATAAQAATPAADTAPDAAAPNPQLDITEIRKEGLTGRQLRMARRIAQKHGLAATSDFDAVRVLRKRGIDPFKRANMLELVVDGNPAGDKADPTPPQLPQTVPQRPAQLPSTEGGSGTHAREIIQIQQDIARRRRRKMALMLARLVAFVMLPTLLAGYYYFVMATPMYATKSEFVIQQAESQAAGGLGSLFSGTGLAVQQDSTQVQGYLQSRDAMRRLDADLGFKAHFSQPEIDPIQRLEADSTDERAYKTYKRNVKIGYDPTEGILKMEVIAADPAVSEAFSSALISYAEERVDGLTQRLREDQMSGARESFEDAENKMRDAQKRVLTLQEQLGVLDPASETAALMGQISNFETQLNEKNLQLQGLLDNARPNQARVDGIRGDIQRLEALIAELRASMTETVDGATSLANISGELRIAELDLETRQMMLQQSLQQLETARVEANRQVRYLSLGVIPVAPDEPTYPRAFENTLLAMLIFAGIYLMISMTASILREQVSG